MGNTDIYCATTHNGHNRLDHSFRPSWDTSRMGIGWQQWLQDMGSTWDSGSNVTVEQRTVMLTVSIGLTTITALLSSLLYWKMTNFGLNHRLKQSHLMRRGVITSHMLLRCYGRNGRLHVCDGPDTGNYSPVLRSSRPAKLQTWLR